MLVVAVLMTPTLVSLVADVFRDRAWGVSAILPHIEALTHDGDQDLSGLGNAVRCSLVYQSGSEHLMTRRALAAFLSVPRAAT